MIKLKGTGDKSTENKMEDQDTGDSEGSEDETKVIEAVPGEVDCSGETTVNLPPIVICDLKERYEEEGPAGKGSIRKARDFCPSAKYCSGSNIPSPLESASECEYWTELFKERTGKDYRDCL